MALGARNVFKFSISSFFRSGKNRRIEKERPTDMSQAERQRYRERPKNTERNIEVLRQRETEREPKRETIINRKRQKETERETDVRD